VTARRPVAESGIDLFSADLAQDPFPAYRKLRDQAAAVYLRAHDSWVLTRYDDVRAAAGDWQTFSSAQGVALLPQFNAMQAGTVLASDPPDHAALRAVLSDQLAPRAINKLRADIRRQADQLVDSVVQLGKFDAVTQFAQRLPVQVVADLIGLPEEGRENLLPGADAMFTTFGPFTPTLQERLPLIEAYAQWMLSVTDREHLRPGSWGAAILDAVDQGRLAPESAFPLMSAFLVAGMDTTVNGIASMLRVFAERPDVWTQLRENPALAANAFEETLRVESPVQAFFRVTTRDAEIDGTVVPAQSRVMLHFGAANRDERHYPDPDRFDLQRNSLDHMAFGYGNHGCAGQGVARMEARAIVGALLDRVESFELAGEPRRHYNPVVRGLEELPLSVRPRKD
jgi:cytochrome P450